MQRKCLLLHRADSVTPRRTTYARPKAVAEPIVAPLPYPRPPGALYCATGRGQSEVTSRGRFDDAGGSGGSASVGAARDVRRRAARALHARILVTHRPKTTRLRASVVAATVAGLSSRRRRVPTQSRREF